METKRAVNTTLAAVVIIIILVAAGAGIYFATQTGGSPSTTSSSTSSSSSHSTSSSSTSSSSTSTTSTTSSAAVPASLVYETAETPEYLDPHVEYFSYDSNILQNVYEPLLWYNGTSSTQVIPWLAQSYNGSADGMTYSFTLRSGIKFADGASLNSTDVWFSFNRVLVGDSSTPKAHGSQGTWILQQLLNTSLSTTLCGCSQTYGTSYVNSVLAEGFIQVTGPLTFKFHLMHPNAAFAVILANSWGFIMDPSQVMQKDIATWQSNSYTLPYATPSGNLMNQMKQYFYDFSSTCNTGATPSGCGATYYDQSTAGSTAGTGPYVLTSFDPNTNNIVLKANPNYWGGPYQFSKGPMITPKIGEIDIKFVPDQSTRTIDLQNAARSGQAMTVDLTSDHIYDFADRSTWLNQNKLVSTVPGINIYGVYPQFSTLFDPFDTNVSSPLTGNFLTFQPFADLRFRQAFADAVNLTDVDRSVGNNLQPVATMVNPPGLPPAGSYNPNIHPNYSYNTTKAAALLVDAMEHPITTFHFANGTLAPPGFFDNSFGCTTLNSQNMCDNPKAQTITLVFGTGDTLDEAVFNQIAGAINTISSTYNMGLTVSVSPLPTGQLLTEAFSTPSRLYMYSLGWIDDYPWVVDFLGPMFAPAQAYTGSGGWNLTKMADLYSQSVTATEKNNITGLVSISNAMNTIANQQVMYLWTFYSTNYVVMTSNVQGFYYNPSLYTAAGGGIAPEYFAALY
ncbi:MAG TPA: ABC transporter substrate-binding protein [Nitrososphaerales archaeon]|nr:ABC transporter substrate-binding protein [Nitrososphaerales archaeon]